ncbi:MAG: YihY family inner membrane protein [Cryobacterium sp.]|nr:YihY family inner membrane protein [Oligoflexia bacterium]
MDTARLFRDAEIPSAASSLAYTTILSIIPLLAVSFSIFKAFGGLEKLYGTIEPFIFENLAEGSDEKTLALVRTFVGNIHAGTLGVTGMIGLMFTSMSMLASVEKSINKIWQTKLSRSFFHRITGYWFFITLGPLALSIVIGVATALDLPLSKVLPSGTPFLVILVALFYCLYAYVPHQRVDRKAALIASIGTSLTWILAKVGYGLYVRKVVSYDKIYGSLGAIPIFLVWIYVAWLVILTGAAFSASLQNRFSEPESEEKK